MRVAVCVALLAARANAQDWNPLRIAGIEAAPGAKASGFIEVSARNDGGTRIPITIVRGAKQGPTLALIAGTHGSEVAPIIALQKLRSQVDAARMSGTLLLVHVANMPSFLARTIYYSPADGKNLNRVYPGKPDGTLSERIAFAITSDIIARADYLVDMHAGDGNESLRPYTYWSILGINPKVDDTSKELALHWGHQRIIVDTDRPTNPDSSVYTQNTAQLRNKPSITTETGFLGVPDSAMVEMNVASAKRLMRYLKMLPGAAEETRNPIYLRRTEVLRSPETGVWHAAVARGQMVANGATIGRLTDFFGNTVATITAPFAGEVLYVVGTPAMNRGEPVGMLGARR